MAKNELTSNQPLIRRFKGPGVEITLTEEKVGKRPRRATLTILDHEDEPWAPPIELIVIDPNEPKMYLKPCIFHYPGATRHPAGDESARSWFNDHGEGWLRISTNEHRILIPLNGAVVDPDARAIPTRGMRGPPRSLDLWLAISALLSPHSITSATLAADTGFNAFNIHRWLTQSADRGLLQKPSSSPLLRFKRYRVCPEQVSEISEFIRASWSSWRKGEGIERLKAQRRYFVSSHDWLGLKNHFRSGIFATGVTWLEGHSGGPKLISPAGNIPQLSFLCSASSWKSVQSTLGITCREERKKSYDSEVTILEDAHPLLHIIENRLNILNNKAHPEPEQALLDLNQPPSAIIFPSGLRVLDGMDDPSPRVREAAEKEWSTWTQHLAALLFAIEGKWKT